jgi:hypothetical protein
VKQRVVFHRFLCAFAALLGANSSGAASGSDGNSTRDPLAAAGWRYEELRRIAAPEARQGVAVDAEFLYAIGNHVIGKYRKDTAVRVAGWEGPDNGPITHLNAGMVRDGRLYCAHSNYPQIPMLSSVEIWDTRTMRHISTHSFGRMDGSLTWIDWHDGRWFACFAHYGGTHAEPGRDPSWTQILSFDEQWRRLEGWTLPADLVARMGVRGYTCSGGGFGPGGYLYATGHDATELYVLALPDAGSVLRWVATVPIAAEGQAFCWDPVQPDVMYSILKRTRQVIAARVRPASG